MEEKNFKIGPYFKESTTAYNVSVKIRRLLFFLFIGAAIVNEFCAIGIDLNKKK